MESGMAKSLNNQVLCMISEYHLMCLSQGPSYISPVLLEAAKNLLTSVEEYMAGGGFQGTRDLRVLEKAKTLWVAVWLHRLDMATAGDGVASYSLDAARHGRGPLLEFLLAPQASSLTFEEVIHWVLAENRYKIESSLDNVWELWAWLQTDSMTSLRLTKRSLSNLLRRSLGGIWSGGGETSKVLRPPSPSMSPAFEGPRFTQKEPWPVKMIHLTLVLRALKRWLLHQ